MLGAGFGLAVLTLSVLHVLADGLDLVLPSAGWRGAQAATALTAAVLLGAVAGWHRVRGLPPVAVPHAMGVVTTVVGLSAAVHLVLTADPLQAMYLMLTLVASGAVLPVLGWLLVLDVICLAALTVAGLPRAALPGWQHVAVVLLFSVAAAHLLHGMRGRAYRRLDQLTAALAAQATRDELTGVLKRRGLQDAAASPVPRDRSQPAAPARAPGWCTWMSTVSRGSTTSSDTPPVTPCSSRSPTGSGSWCAPGTWSRESAGTSSPSCCPTSAPVTSRSWGTAPGSG